MHIFLSLLLLFFYITCSRSRDTGKCFVKSRLFVMKADLRQKKTHTLVGHDWTFLPMRMVPSMMLLLLSMTFFWCWVIPNSLLMLLLLCFTSPWQLLCSVQPLSATLDLSMGTLKPWVPLFGGSAKPLVQCTRQAYI